MSWVGKKSVDPFAGALRLTFGRSGRGMAGRSSWTRTGILFITNLVMVAGEHGGFGLDSTVGSGLLSTNIEACLYGMHTKHVNKKKNTLK